MIIGVFGLNHTTAPVEIRETLYLSESITPILIEELKEHGISENVILSTCNRTEIYFATEDMEETIHTIKKILEKHCNIQPEWLSNYTYCFTGKDAYRHLFLVASGLDSMVIGEPQILGQVKDAYRTATFHNTTGFFLNKVFHKTFNVAKRIRRETKIGYNPLSITSVAIELSKKIFGELKHKRILVVGAGEMCTIALKYFKKEGVKEILITNRTFHNAEKLAEEVIGTAYPFRDIPELLTAVDMVLTSTGSEQPIINKETVTGVMKKRKNKPLFFIDIAVPRDVDPFINDIENVYLYNIDDLMSLSQIHRADRMTESRKANAIVDEEINKFIQWLQHLDMGPLITDIFLKAEEIREKELQKALSRLNTIDDETLKIMNLLTKNIVNKLLHPHVSLIKKNGTPQVLEMMKKLFKLEGFEENDDEEKLDSWDKG